MQNASKSLLDCDLTRTRETPHGQAWFSSGSRSGPREMFNILCALESADRLLTVRDVAKLLGKSASSIYRMAQKGQIPSLTIGGSRCFDPSVLALWLSSKDPSLVTAARQQRSSSSLLV
jgi:excisionase family DNA binding protein